MQNDELDAPKEILPPCDGSFTFTVPVVPVSFQAAKKRKSVVTAAVSAAIKDFEYYLSGEVAIYIEWYGSEARRYETDCDPDVDNIIKPILDALCGKSGIIFDDCQVQTVMCSWIDTLGEDVLQLRFDYMPDLYCPKEGLFFVRYDGNLCMPFNKRKGEEWLPKLIDLNHERVQLKMKIEKEKGVGAARGLMAIQKLFHISRVSSFPIVEYADVKSFLQS